MSGDRAAQEVPEQGFGGETKAASWIDTENTSSSCRQFGSVVFGHFLAAKLRLRGHLYTPSFVCGDPLALAVNIKHIAQRKARTRPGQRMSATYLCDWCICKRLSFGTLSRVCCGARPSLAWSVVNGGLKDIVPKSFLLLLTMESYGWALSCALEPLSITSR